jgi:hypothetical protein
MGDSFCAVLQGTRVYGVYVCVCVGVCVGTAAARFMDRVLRTCTIESTMAQGTYRVGCGRIGRCGFANVVAKAHSRKTEAVGFSRRVVLGGVPNGDVSYKDWLLRRQGQGGFCGLKSCWQATPGVVRTETRAGPWLFLPAKLPAVAPLK